MGVGDDAMLAARHAASQRAFYAQVIPRTPGGRVLSLQGGVQAAITPATPSRSLFNAVVYEDGDALLRGRDELEEAYAASGVEAWTVWVRPGDERVAEGLRSADHSLDARPLLMAARLDLLDLADQHDAPLALDPEATFAAVAAVADLAFAVSPEYSFVPALRGLEGGGARPWVVCVDGRPAAALVTFLHEGDCYVTFVATPPQFRGRGLAGGLLRTALRAARDEHAATSTTLEATALGAPVYERLGYVSLGELGMWERRRAR
jgi:ribosomal protein S18 acetylase RimI-like enzyme